MIMDKHYFDIVVACLVFSVATPYLLVDFMRIRRALADKKNNVTDNGHPGDRIFGSVMGYVMGGLGIFGAIYHLWQ